MIDLTNSNIEKILLRSILKCFGDQYQIVKITEIWENGKASEVHNIILTTNLPYSLYPHNDSFDEVEFSVVTTNRETD